MRREDSGEPEKDTMNDSGIYRFDDAGTSEPVKITGMHNAYGVHYNNSDKTLKRA